LNLIYHFYVLPLNIAEVVAKIEKFCQI